MASNATWNSRLDLRATELDKSVPLTAFDRQPILRRIAAAALKPQDFFSEAQYSSRFEDDLISLTRRSFAVFNSCSFALCNFDML